METIVGKQLTFSVPSGHTVTIMEQNGEHDDILSHPGDAKNLMNISKFISALIVDSDYSTKGKITPEEAHLLPSLDRYCILINSRIHSLGSIIETSYAWPKEEGGPREYEIDLEEFLLSDYQADISEMEKELLEKPEAIPYYPIKEREISLELNSGKKVKFYVLDGAAEAQLLNMPPNDRTKNSELTIRGLQLEIEGKYMRVERFHLFTPKDMAEIRQAVKKFDPAFLGQTSLENPSTGQSVAINIMGIPDFFYLGEM